MKMYLAGPLIALATHLTLILANDPLHLESCQRTPYISRQEAEAAYENNQLVCTGQHICAAGETHQCQTLRKVEMGTCKQCHQPHLLFQESCQSASDIRQRCYIHQSHSSESSSGHGKSKRKSWYS
ncbi:hypothetical protein PGTUg99_008872 [Puccinia graminis f. sp. tritici]|uniref:Secreted protein n=1 Tax=Puccinia graminis f. sp. tritici TaxID=56615 RepID=A0A5B0RJV5_PUCGR|nr:hypothetical protein PGTUg99_008872 [Puccinia graminis f. sp. tritici]